MRLEKRGWFTRTRTKTHQLDERWALGLRILLGLIILFKGIYFAQNTGELQNMITTSRIEFGSVAMAHFIAMAHLVGGLFICIGAITRVAVLFQIPILLGAIFFINTNHGVYEGPYMVPGELILSIVTLLLCVFFLFYGSGRHSVDNYVKKDVAREEARFRTHNPLRNPKWFGSHGNMNKGYASKGEITGIEDHSPGNVFWNTNHRVKENW